MLSLSTAIQNFDQILGKPPFLCHSSLLSSIQAVLNAIPESLSEKSHPSLTSDKAVYETFPILCCAIAMGKDAADVNEKQGEWQRLYDFLAQCLVRTHSVLRYPIAQFLQDAIAVAPCVPSVFTLFAIVPGSMTVPTLRTFLGLPPVVAAAPSSAPQPKKSSGNDTKKGKNQQPPSVSSSGKNITPPKQTSKTSPPPALLSSSSASMDSVSPTTLSSEMIRAMCDSVSLLSVECKSLLQSSLVASPAKFRQSSHSDVVTTEKLLRAFPHLQKPEGGLVPSDLLPSLGSATNASEAESVLTSVLHLMVVQWNHLLSGATASPFANTFAALHRDVTQLMQQWRVTDWTVNNVRVVVESLQSIATKKNQQLQQTPPLCDGPMLLCSIIAVCRLAFLSVTHRELVNSVAPSTVRFVELVCLVATPGDSLSDRFWEVRLSTLHYLVQWTSVFVLSCDDVAGRDVLAFSETFLDTVRTVTLEAVQRALKQQKTTNVPNNGSIGDKKPSGKKKQHADPTPVAVPLNASSIVSSASCLLVTASDLIVIGSKTAILDESLLHTMLQITTFLTSCSNQAIIDYFLWLTQQLKQWIAVAKYDDKLTAMALETLSTNAVKSLLISCISVSRMGVVVAVNALKLISSLVQYIAVRISPYAELATELTESVLREVMHVGIARSTRANDEFIRVADTVLGVAGSAALIPASRRYFSSVVQTSKKTNDLKSCLHEFVTLASLPMNASDKTSSHWKDVVNDVLRQTIDTLRQELTLKEANELKEQMARMQKEIDDASKAALVIAQARSSNMTRLAKYEKTREEARARCSKQAQLAIAACEKAQKARQQRYLALMEEERARQETQRESTKRSIARYLAISRRSTELTKFLLQLGLSETEAFRHIHSIQRSHLETISERQLLEFIVTKSVDLPTDMKEETYDPHTAATTTTTGTFSVLEKDDGGADDTSSMGFWDNVWKDLEQTESTLTNVQFEERPLASNSGSHSWHFRIAPLLDLFWYDEANSGDLDEKPTALTDIDDSFALPMEYVRRFLRVPEHHDTPSASKQQAALLLSRGNDEEDDVWRWKPSTWTRRDVAEDDNNYSVLSEGYVDVSQAVLDAQEHRVVELRAGVVVLTAIGRAYHAPFWKQERSIRWYVLVKREAVMQRVSQLLENEDGETYEHEGEQLDNENLDIWFSDELI